MNNGIIFGVDQVCGGTAGSGTFRSTKKNAMATTMERIKVTIIWGFPQPNMLNARIMNTSRNVDFGILHFTNGVSIGYSIYEKHESSGYGSNS